ncbi:oxygenase MpaB family protein [Nocardia vermiculata]|uniref:DUF2236 domain-containing protein n=1 Tax=Nocardia vermiculata TaxID=257274 RepID=A0A846XPT6_9NOCA|nr:oxygenase MpaB family protein [Nocardia vermiculata]NKY49036.1 DUF2236 domain-containing protein [Nocardia vermiculata]
MTAAPLRTNDYEPEHPGAELTPETVREHIDGIAAFLGGAANVILQLSHPPVGYGVLESTVDSGKLTLHPVKRMRTTMTYLAVAWLGDDRDRADYRDAINGSHRPVHSGPESPVKYNAFDPKLQLWVAACLYWGVDDLYQRMRGPMDPELAERFYRYSARLGTTLQVRAEMWPATRAEFYEYWDRTITERTIDEPVRRYFNDMVDLKMTAKPVQLLAARFHRFTVTALLPQHLREQMGMTWSDRDERWFRRIVGAISAVWTRMPEVIRLFPFNYFLADMRLRRRFGKPLV